MDSRFVTVNGIQLHYLDYPGDGPTIILTHGLTVNAWTLDPLARLLSPHWHVIAVDLRGRGLSDKPATGYAMSEIAADILALMDHLGLPQSIIGGHSSGGLLTLFMAATYPDRVTRPIILDAGIMHPKVGELIGPSVARLGVPWPNWEAYLTAVKNGPELLGWWDPTIEDYCRADVQTNPDGTVSRRAQPAVITQVIAGQGAVNWMDILGSIKQPSILINAPGGYGPGDTPAMMPKELGQKTASLMPNCRYVEVPGNHFTMLYAIGVDAVAKAISDFLNEP
jgi:pimeloyl-ACP methyl ester carboxylesterase